LRPLRYDEPAPATRAGVPVLPCRGPYPLPMAARREAAELPAEFRNALATLRSATVRAEVSLSETPAPARLAPYSVAITGDVRVGESELATGRLVVLHDPAGQDAWDGRTRCVAYVRAGMEVEIAGDPLLPAVGWSWLVEALDGRAAGYLAAGGTVTRAASERFGTLAGGADAGEFEVRASWTPVPINGGLDLEPHLAAWGDLLCIAAGLPPEVPGVVLLPTRSRRP